jgi:hypothetical protein
LPFFKIIKNSCVKSSAANKANHETSECRGVERRVKYAHGYVFEEGKGEDGRRKEKKGEERRRKEKKGEERRRKEKIGE